MTELKNALRTLKDFEELEAFQSEQKENGDFGGKEVIAIFLEDLRQEAIKWIKELQKVKQSTGIEVIFAYDYHIKDVVSVIKWIKHFFNITDEELGSGALKGYLP